MPLQRWKSIEEEQRLKVARRRATPEVASRGGAEGWEEEGCLRLRAEEEEESEEEEEEEATEEEATEEEEEEKEEKEEKAPSVEPSAPAPGGSR
jgi:hypothetical protein